MSNFKSMGARHIDGFRRTPRSPLSRGNQNQKFEEFKVYQPQVWEWLERNKGSFAESLKARLQQVGSLSKGQLDAVHNIIIRDQQKAAEKAAAPAVEEKPSIGDGAVKIIQVFKRAREQGLKKPSIRTEHFDLAFAPEHGRNPGWLYVTNAHDCKYRGKIDPEGRYHGDMQGEELESLKALMADPLEEAIRFGKQFGICSCCGRELSNPESVELGIGPICRSKFFG